MYKRQKVWNAAKAELALRAILKAKGAKGFTTNFDDLDKSITEGLGAKLKMKDLSAGDLYAPYDKI